MLFVVSFVLVLIERLLSRRISLSQWVADLHAYRWGLVRPLGSIQECRQVHVRVFESSCLQSFICTWFFRILVILGQLLRLRVSWGFFVKVVINQEIVHIILSTLRLFVSFSYLHIVKLVVFCEHTEAQLSHNVIILSGLPCVSYNLINFFFLSDRSFARTFQIWYTFKVWYAFTQRPSTKSSSGSFFSSAGPFLAAFVFGTTIADEVYSSNCCSSTSSIGQRELLLTLFLTLGLMDCLIEFLRDPRTDPLTD